jgi:hypothetical protein
LGEEFVAVVAISRRVESEDGINCSLICESTLTTSDSDSQSTSTSKIYNNTIVVCEDMAAAAEGRSVIPIAFTIPEDKPQRDLDSNPTITWKIELAAATPGIDFAAEFADLPVYWVDRQPKEII